MKNVGYIYVDDGYPESADYDNNYIAYDQDAPGGYKKALAEASAQLRHEKLNASEVPAPGTSALRFAKPEKNAASRLGQYLSDTFKLLSGLLIRWWRSGKKPTGGEGPRSATWRQFVPGAHAGTPHFGKRRAFGW